MRVRQLKAMLTPEQLRRCTFVPEAVPYSLMRKHRFGRKWPSSGLLMIWHALAHPSTFDRVHLHGFDFFKKIDGKIHYMEDSHKSDHSSSEEERICQELVQRRSVFFI